MLHCKKIKQIQASKNTPPLHCKSQQIDNRCAVMPKTCQNNQSPIRNNYPSQTSKIPTLTVLLSAMSTQNKKKIIVLFSDNMSHHHSALSALCKRSQLALKKRGNQSDFPPATAQPPEASQCYARCRAHHIRPRASA